MKDRWKFCQCCYLNGHCENQDRNMKCENYSKQLEDKVERLQEQMKEANELIKDYVHDANDCFTMGRIRRYLEKWGVK